MPVGLAVAGTGGAANIIGTTESLIGGGINWYETGDYKPFLNSATELAITFSIMKLKSISSTSGRTVSQRATNAELDRDAAIAGGAADSVATALEAIAPQDEAHCP